MTTVTHAILQLKIWKEDSGQDLTEYALMAGFLAAASAVTLPQLASNIANVLATVIAVLGDVPYTSPGA